MREILGPFFALAASLTTLVCCALPALLISIGAGAVMAGLAANVPGLIFLSERKGLVFGVAGGLLALAALMRWMTRNAPCPVDPVAARACKTARRDGGVVLWVAVIAYGVGGFFAFFAADLIA